MLEANKDEAFNCLDRAREYLSQNERDKAIKFIQKSLRLYPTPQAQKLLDSIQNNDNNDGHSNNDNNNGSSSNNNNNNNNNRRHQHHHNNNSTAAPPPHTSQPHTSQPQPSQQSSSTTTTKSYTEEQLIEVKGKLKIKNYYELLEIEKTATDEHIKKAFRKVINCVLFVDCLLIVC